MPQERLCGGWWWRCKPFTKYHEFQSLLLTESITTVRSEIKYFLSIYVSNPHPLPAERYLPRNQWHLICNFLQQSLLRISQQTQPFWIQRMNRPNVMQNHKLRIQRLQPRIFSDYQNLFVSASRTNEFSYLALVWCDPWRSWPLPPLENPRCCWTISMLSLLVSLLLCGTGNL